jgi:hypothetical protein
MAATGHNKGFHVLDDFVCDAIHAPSVPLANPANQGQNGGMLVLDELIFEGEKGPSPVALDDAIKSEIGRLAAVIAASPDPARTVALVQRLLVAQVESITKSTNGG